MTTRDDFIDQLSADTHFGFLDSNTVAPRFNNPRLISNDDSGTMLHAINHELRRAIRFTFSVAFVTPSALAMLKQSFVDSPGSGIIITSTYLGFNSPETFYELLNLPNTDVFVFNPAKAFHAKGYVFEHDTSTTAIVGSSNLTATALVKNNEWNLKFSALPDGDIVHQITSAIDDQMAEAVPLTKEWIESYSRTYRPVARATSQVILPQELQDRFDAPDAIRPNTMQQEALAQIKKVRDSGETRAIVVSATGTGKTILSALDVQAVNPDRMLFIVHREQILDRAIEEYKRVFSGQNISIGKLAGGVDQRDRQYLFATVQSLSRPDTLRSFDAQSFDYIIIDEVHRAGAKSYLQITQHFKPEFLLGFTATPERSDDFDIFEHFDHNVPYEIRLQEALEADMLTPFHYYGVTDYETADGVTITDKSDLKDLVMPERIEHLLKNISVYGHAGVAVKGLIFCRNVADAEALSVELNGHKIHDKRLRTKALSGGTPVAEREESVQMLEAGELDYLITVDIFNEGVDIPSLNQVVMMRQTESSIVFTQQLGRGLRKYPGKDHLVVIDFIGNYENNYLIPTALFGDSSLNKDTLRKKLIDAKEAGVISGLSSVNFDRIASERVFKSIARTNLNSWPRLKQHFNELRLRLGQTPALFDFARFGTVDPVVIANKEIDNQKKNYWSVLHKIEAVDTGPNETESKLLTFLSRELLNGKRQHEILLLQELLKRRSSSKTYFADLLRSKGGAYDSDTILSVSRILDLTFFREPQQIAYGEEPIASFKNENFTISKKFLNIYNENSAFATHVDDALATGLYTNHHKYNRSGSFVIGEQYSRKDACRILNWSSDQESSIFGYKVDRETNTCPIFVSYLKVNDARRSNHYRNELTNLKEMKWISTKNRTFKSLDLQPIVSGEVPLYIFVQKTKKDPFFYLGQAVSKNAKETSILEGKNESVPVVSMSLELEKPLTQSLFDYLKTPSSN